MAVVTKKESVDNFPIIVNMKNNVDTTIEIGTEFICIIVF